MNHVVKLLSATTATVCDAVTDRLISLPPWIRRRRHYAMLHRRRYLFDAYTHRSSSLNFRLYCFHFASTQPGTYSRMYVCIQGSRPDLIQKLEETIGEYEMSVVPRSICAVDGSLYIPGDKAIVLCMPLKKPRKNQQNLYLLSTYIVALSGHPSRVLIIDAMAVLQGMKKSQQR